MFDKEKSTVNLGRILKKYSLDDVIKKNNADKFSLSIYEAIGGESKSHSSHGKSKESQYKIRDILRNVIDAYLRAKNSEVAKMLAEIFKNFYKTNYFDYAL